MCTENLALHQLVWQSSTWLSDTGAQRAVDGRYTGRCAESFNNPTAEWRVDLTGVKNIHHVFIQHATGKSMLGIISLKITDCYLN